MFHRTAFIDQVLQKFVLQEIVLRSFLLFYNTIISFYYHCSINYCLGKNLSLTLWMLLFLFEWGKRVFVSRIASKTFMSVLTFQNTSLFT